MKTLEDKYFHFSEERALDQDILDHLHYIKEAVEKNIPKAKAIQTATKIMFWIVIMLLAAVAFGVLFPSPTLSDVIKSAIEFLYKVKP